MGKFKVSFTTALFVFSFLVCVIIAVVFVDRAPENDYDSFYDADASGQKSAAPGENQGGWDPSAPATASVQSPAAAAPTPLLTDLPIDPHLAIMAQPIPATVTPAATANPMAGRSPEEIARALMGKAGVEASAEAATVPGMAVPAGIATPAGATAPAVTATPAATPRTYLPMQSNVQGGAQAPVPGGPQLYQMPSLHGNDTPAIGGVTNSSEWSPVSAQSSPSNLIGVHKATGTGGQQGMMIGEGRIESGAQPPPGLSTTPVNEGHMSVPSLQSSPASALPGSADKPLLMPPGSSGNNKWELPPSPTLRPPPIQDPDQRRSDADQTPDGLNPGETSDQAFAISEAPAAEGDAGEAAPESTETAEAEPAVPAADVAAQVNDKVLKKSEALRLARVKASLQDKKLVKEEEDDAAEKAALEWKEVMAAAAQARADSLDVGIADVERYAAMRPDFDPAAWQLAMEDEGFSAEEIREHLKAIALSEKLIDVKFAEDTDDEEIRKAYDKSPSKFKRPRLIHLQEIYKAKPNDEGRAERVSKEMARLRRQAAGGTDFGLLARQVSEGSTARRGGNLGWINPSENKNPARDKALEDLKQGDVSEVVEDDDGFTIYKLIEEKEPAKDFETAREVVVAELKKSVRDEAFENVLEKLEAGELGGGEAPADQPARATAAADRPAGAVVQTRVGSSLRSAPKPAANPVEAAAATPAETADAKPAGDDSRENSSDSAARATAAADSSEAVDEQTARKFRAQELLGQANARKSAAEAGRPYYGNQEMEAAQTATVMHHPGQQTQLLYAPGSQPQQMASGQAQTMQPRAAGGQPQSPYQAGGQMQTPVQASMQAPSRASFNAMGATSMEPNGSMQHQAQAYADGRAGAGTMPDQQQQATPRLEPNQTQMQSNGWNVVKTVDSPGSEQAQAPQEPMPPGFGPSPEGAQQAGNGQERRGIVGSVRSFFGSIGR